MPPNVTLSLDADCNVGVAEVLMEQKYGSSVDIWALGCTLFEIMMLGPAFVHGESDQTRTNQNGTIMNIIYARHAPILTVWSTEL